MHYLNAYRQSEGVTEASMRAAHNKVLQYARLVELRVPHLAKYNLQQMICGQGIAYAVMPQ